MRVIPPPHARRGRTIVRAVAFLAGFTAFLLVVTFGYLIPALTAARDASPEERKRLAASGSLVMLVVLFVLFAGLVLTFRLGRFLFPRTPPGRAKPTEYVDAWAEAGRRAEVPEEE